MGFEADLGTPQRSLTNDNNANWEEFSAWAEGLGRYIGGGVGGGLIGGATLGVDHLLLKNVLPIDMSPAALAARGGTFEGLGLTGTQRAWGAVSPQITEQLIASNAMKTFQGNYFEYNTLAHTASGQLNTGRAMEEASAAGSAVFRGALYGAGVAVGDMAVGSLANYTLGHDSATAKFMQANWLTPVLTTAGLLLSRGRPTVAVGLATAGYALSKYIYS